MSVRVMLVDDSLTIRSLISRALSKHEDIKVIAEAGDGIEAEKMARLHKPDIILLDIEMPHMDGLTSIGPLLQAAPHVKIIMVSALTQRSAYISLKALEMGASDYIAKPTNGQALDAFLKEVVDKVRVFFPMESAKESISRSRTKETPVPDPVKAPEKRRMNIFQTQREMAPLNVGEEKSASSPLPVRPPSLALANVRINAVAIACSTGGPTALLRIFSTIKNYPFKVPVFITQHMPPIFTQKMADNIHEASGIPCAEGQDGEIPQPGRIYIAPGDYHMLIKNEGGPVIRLSKSPPVHSCRPAADPMFESIADVYGRNTLAFVLTGMGYDGRNGAQKIFQCGGTVVAQSKESCAVYGMPRGVVDAQVAHAVLDLKDIPDFLRKYV